MFASLLGSAVRRITERLSGFDDSLAATNATQVEHASRLTQLESTIAVQARTIHQLTERLDIARNERFAVDQTIKRVAYEFQTAHSATLARLENQDALIKAQDEGIASIDKVQELQGEILYKYGKRISELEFQGSNARAGHEPASDEAGKMSEAIDTIAQSQAIHFGHIARLIDRVVKLESIDGTINDELRGLQAAVLNSDHTNAREINAMLSKIHEIQRAHNADFGTLSKCLEINAESFAKLDQRVTDFHTVQNIVIQDATKLDQRVTDLIASLQYTGAPAEFVRYTHAADLAEIVRKLVRVELNSFDFSPRIDIAVRDAAIRALANLTNDRRQSGSFAMAGPVTAWGAGGSGGVNAGKIEELHIATAPKSVHQSREPQCGSIDVQRDPNGKPII